MLWATEAYVRKESEFGFWIQAYFFKIQSNPGMKSVLKVICPVLKRN